MGARDSCLIRRAHCHSALPSQKDQSRTLLSLVQLECIDCLVQAAEDAQVPLDDITSFVDRRYMGAMETCSRLQQSPCEVTKLYT
eukprot:g59638.t1